MSAASRAPFFLAQQTSDQHRQAPRLLFVIGFRLGSGQVDTLDRVLLGQDHLAQFAEPRRPLDQESSASQALVVWA